MPDTPRKNWRRVIGAIVWLIAFVFGSLGGAVEFFQKFPSLQTPNVQITVEAGLLAIGIAGFSVIIWDVFFRKKGKTGNKPDSRLTALVDQYVRGRAEESQQRHLHYEKLLAVYRTWAKCVLTHPSRYNYGSISFRIRIVGLPIQEDYYIEARKDLECYEKTYDLLLDAEKRVEESNNRGDLLVTDMEQEVARCLGAHGLKEWDKGGRETDKWYYNHVIPLLIIKPIVDGRPRLALENGKIRAPEEGYELAGNFDLLEEAGLKGSVVTPARLLTGQSNAEKKWIQMFSNLSTELVPEFSKNILELQDDLKKAEQAYDLFKDSLLNEVIKRLETGFPLPDGGKCKICLSLRA